jgi:hypothetical protein
MKGRRFAAACPFCGRSDNLSVDGNRESTYWIVCDTDGCCCEGPYRKTPEAALDAWNARAEGKGAVIALEAA